MFCYANGKSQSDHTDDLFVPDFLSETSLEQKFEAALQCGNRSQCQLDYIITRNKDFAKSTSDVQNIYDESIAVIGRI